MRRATILIGLSSVLAAHDLYLKPAQFVVPPGAIATVEFHSGDTFPTSQVPPVLERIRDAQVMWASGTAAMTGLRTHGQSAIAEFLAPTANGFLLTARTTPNFIELDAKKFEEYLQHEGLADISAWRRKHSESAQPGRELYSKYIKSILHTSGTDSFVTKPAGLAIEFVPMVDPVSIRPGGELTVTLFVHGKPAPGLPVEASSFHEGKRIDRQLGKTDAHGIVRIRLDVPGIWKLHSICMERLVDRHEADWASFWASLTFSIPETGKRIVARRGTL